MTKFDHTRDEPVMLGTHVGTIGRRLAPDALLVR